MNRHAKDKGSSKEKKVLKVIKEKDRRETNYRALFHAYQQHDQSEDYHHHAYAKTHDHSHTSTDTYLPSESFHPTSIIQHGTPILQNITHSPTNSSQYSHPNPMVQMSPPHQHQPSHHHHQQPYRPQEPQQQQHRHPAYPWAVPYGRRKPGESRKKIEIPSLPPTPPTYLQEVCHIERRSSSSVNPTTTAETSREDEQRPTTQGMVQQPPRPPERVTFVNGRYYPAFSFPSLFHSTSIYIIHSLDSCYLPCGKDILSEENVFNIRLNDVTALHYFPQLLWNIIYTEELRMKKYYIASGIDEINLYIKLRSYDEVEYIKSHIAGSFAHYDIVPINIPAMECCMCIGFNDEEINELGITISRPKASAVNETTTVEPVTTPSSNQSTEITKTMTMSDGFTEIFSTAGDQREIPFKYSEAVNTDNIDILHTPTPYSQPENDDVYLMTRQAQKKPVGIPVTTPSYAAAARNIIHRKPTTFNNHTLRRQLQPTQKQPTSKKSSRYRFTSYSTSSSDSLKLDMSIIKEEEEDEEANSKEFTIEETTASDTNIDVCDDMEEATVSGTNIDVCDIEDATMSDTNIDVCDIEEATASDTNIDVCDSEVDRIFNLSIFT